MTDLPRVSAILKPYIDTTWFTDESRERGSLVHNYCSNYALGLWSPPVPEEYRGWTISFKNWFDTVVEEVILIEKDLYDEQLGFGGRPDAILRIKGDKELSIPDWKTSTLPRKVWEVQVNGAYRYLAEKNGYKIQRTFPVRLDRDGGPAKASPEYLHAGQDIGLFLRALDLFRFFSG